MEFVLQLIIVLACLVAGAKLGGMGLGLVSGVGLAALIFLFGLAPGEPPVGVILTILAVIGCAATLQVAGGLDVMMRVAERVLRRHPQHITILAPITTWLLTVMCGTGHVVYTMFPIINDIAISKNIRPERPMAVASISSQMGVTASPVSVATVSLVSILGEQAGIMPALSIIDILKVSIPASLAGVILAALWSLRRGKDLDKDEAFQERIKDPVQRQEIYGNSETLLDTKSPRTAYAATWIFLTAIAVVVVFGAFEQLRPSWEVDGGTQTMSMNLIIQMFMLVAGACILLFGKVQPRNIPNSAVFKAGMTAIFAVFGVAWMADTFFDAHIDSIELTLADLVTSMPWTYAVALLITSKLVNSQAAALTAIAPMGLAIGVPPEIVIGFFGASYGYWVLPTYPSDLACIGFDRSGTTRIGRFVVNHSFFMPGFIAVATSCVIGFLIAQVAF